jgi:flagellar biosynthetic protein FliP
MGVLLTLGFVLALLGIALKLLRRFAPTSSSGAALRMEVVQRLALGPKQGIAVIRIGERVVAVSVGDGGVNRLFELEGAEFATGDEGRATGENSLIVREARPTSPLDFKAAFKGALRTAGLAVVFAVLSAGTIRAQQVTAKPPSRAQLQNIAAQAVSGAKAAKSPAELVAAMTNTANGGSPVARRSSPVSSSGSPSATQMDVKLGGSEGLHLSGTVGVVVMMGFLTLLPTLLLMMTGFTRILIVLNFLKQALGTQTTPPTQLVAALALLLTGFVMAPTLNEVNRTALTPWMDGQIDQAQMMEIGAKPFRAFMLKQTRRADIETFVRISHLPAPATMNDVPMVTLTSAFVISELRTAFQIGFALFLPFIIIDVAVSSVLMSMGMFMLPPAMISLPFKLLLFVLVDGWSLIVQSLVTSFR